MLSVTHYAQDYDWWVHIWKQSPKINYCAKQFIHNQKE